MVKQMTFKEIVKIYDVDYSYYNGVYYEFYKDGDVVFEAQVVGENSDGDTLFETI